MTTSPVAALTSGGPPRKIVPCPGDDHVLVAHRRDIGSAGGARAHNRGQLGDAGGRHPRLVVEDPPEVLAVGEDLGLHGQVRPSGVDEVTAREAVVSGNLLGTQMLFHRNGEVSASFHGGVVGHDEAGPLTDTTDPGHEPGCGKRLLVEVVAGEAGQLEEGRSRVDEAVDPVTHQHLVACQMPLTRRLAPSLADDRQSLA